MAERDWVGSDILDLLKPRLKQPARARRARQSGVDDLVRMLYRTSEADAETLAAAAPEEDSPSGSVKITQVVRLLRAEREARGLSLGDLYEATGISCGRLSRIENRIETNPTIGTLERIAEALGMQVVVSLVEAGD